MTPEYTMAHYGHLHPICLPPLPPHPAHSILFTCLRDLAPSQVPLQLGPRTGIAKPSAHGPRLGNRAPAGGLPPAFVLPHFLPPQHNTSSWLIAQYLAHSRLSRNEWFLTMIHGPLVTVITFRHTGVCEEGAPPGLQRGSRHGEGGGLGADCQLDFENASSPAPFPYAWEWGEGGQRGNIEMASLWGQKTHIRHSLGPAGTQFSDSLRSQKSRVRAPPRPLGTEFQPRGQMERPGSSGPGSVWGSRSQVEVEGGSLGKKPSMSSPAQSPGPETVAKGEEEETAEWSKKGERGDATENSQEAGEK